MQAPSSPFYFGGLPGPVGQLRGAAMWLSLTVFALAWLMPWLMRAGPAGWLVRAIYVGTVVLLGGLVYGAATPMHGIQLQDPRVAARVVAYVKICGGAVLLVCVVDVMRRIFTRTPS